MLSVFTCEMMVWFSGNALVSISKVNLRWAQLVLGWVTVPGSILGTGKSISVYNQPPMLNQPGHPSVGRSNEY